MPGTLTPTDGAASAGRRMLLLCVLAWLFGALIHLRSGACRPGLMWGDSGDGFFNLWILRHGAGWLAGADSLSDGRIFWPENARSFFWSDNLLLLAPVFLLLQGILASPFAAFYSLGVGLAAAGFAVCAFFFHQVLAVARRVDSRPAPCWLAPLLSYLAFFSAGLQTYFFAHFQNLSFFWLILMAGAMLAFLRSSRPIWFLVVWISVAALFLSTPYFAVAGVVLLAAWSWAEWFRDGIGWRAGLRKTWPGVLLCLAVMGLVSIQYARAGMQRFEIGYINSMSVSWADLVRPGDDFSRAALDRLAPGLCEAEVTQPAFLGWGFVLAALAWLVRDRRRIGTWLGRQARSPWALAFLVPLVLSQAKIRELRPFFSVLGFLAVAVGLPFAAAAAGRRGRASPRAYAIGLLALFAVLLYGIAFGPKAWYLRQPLNPSIWGVLRFALPGLAGMRASGRLAVVGLILAWGVLAALLRSEEESKGRPGRFWWWALLLPALWQVVDQLPVRASVTMQDEKTIQPTHAERIFWAGRSGRAVVLPAGPFHRNTEPMLYFQAFPGVVLVNGYSGRSTELLDGLMQAGLAWGEGSVKQVAVCEQAGAEWIVLRRSEIPGWRIEALKQSGRRLALDGERFAVFEPLNGRR